MAYVDEVFFTIDIPDEDQNYVRPHNVLISKQTYNMIFYDYPDWFGSAGDLLEDLNRNVELIPENIAVLHKHHSPQCQTDTNLFLDIAKESLAYVEYQEEEDDDGRPAWLNANSVLASEISVNRLRVLPSDSSKPTGRLIIQQPSQPIHHTEKHKLSPPTQSTLLSDNSLSTAESTAAMDSTNSEQKKPKKLKTIK